MDVITSTTSNATRTAVELRSTRVRLGGVEILHDIDLAVPAGSVVGLLGPSGCGKTTLMRTIVGLQRPSAGSVDVLGLPAGSAGLRRRVAYVTQAPSVYEDLEVGENLAYFARILRAGDDVAGSLEATGLSPLSGRLVAGLSGGQRARVSLATALLGSPELLVLDEPTTGLDPVLRAQLWDTMRGLARAGATLLVSSHVIEEARYCDSLVLMREGRILATGDVDSLLRETGAADVNDAFLRLVEMAPSSPPAAGAARPTVTASRPARSLEVPRPADALATAARVMRQSRHDPVSALLVASIPLLLMTLMRFVFASEGTFERIAVPLLGIFPFMTLFLVTSVALLRERRAGTLERLMTMPVARVDLVAGYLVAFGCQAAVQIVLTGLFVFGLLAVEPQGSLLAIGLVAFATALVGTAFGLLASAIARTEYQAVLWMALLVLPQVMLCGLLAPRSGMAVPLQAVAAAMPLTYAYDLLDHLGSGAALSAARAILDTGVLLVSLLAGMLGATATLSRSSR
ncbi:MAG TPA: ATP-binding cassette domain-containing protein [Solirubrobacterales bacterium]|nr:ATP-binding cassette domain-containing protein [Solirubrobacterales bacterium]